MLPSKRLVRAAALGIALVVLACGVLAVRSARRGVAGCHPARKAIREEERAAARRVDAGLEDVSFRTPDGLTLRGWWVPSRNHAAVILVHGGTDNRTHWMPELRVLAERGYGVLAFDCRGAGESDGEVVTAGDREQIDVAAALGFVAGRADVDRARIALLGLSIGASAVAMQAARDPRVRAVVIEALWTSLEEETRYKNRKWGPLTAEPALWAMRREGVDVSNVRPIEHVAEISPRPFLVITGADDDDTPVPVMERVFAAAREPKEMWVVAGAHHGDYASAGGTEYARRLVAFLDAALLDRDRGW